MKNKDRIYLKGLDRFFVNTWIPITILLSCTMMITIDDSHANQFQIPVWVKNNAKWWSEGQIGDSEFIKGIQYLIQQQIIQIPKTAPSSNNQNQIPMWIKNNAGWWANGTIGDTDFVKGIQYLVQINIININLPEPFLLSSSAFEDNGTIPSQYTCNGSDMSPPLTITGVPANVTSLALIVDDVDAPHGIFTHWLVWNITPDKTQFYDGENIGFPQGTTSAGTIGYHGPCPPSGNSHRYYFKLYALDSILDLNNGSTKNDLESSMNGHIISQTTLLGRFSR